MYWEIKMNKKEILQQIFDIENISTKIVNCPKITEASLLNILSKSSYSLKDELNLTHTTITRYLTKLFPDRDKSCRKVDNWLLHKYEYKQCKHCEEVFELSFFHKNSNRSDSLNAYCKVCQNTLTAATSASRQAKYKSSKLQRSPLWVSLEEEAQISLFYKNCPEGYHVDHDFPLQGELVSGLHVLSNLRYLTMEENCGKGNKFLPC